MKDSLTKAVLRRYCMLREMHSCWRIKNAWQLCKIRASIMISMPMWMLDLHYSFIIIIYHFLKLSEHPNTLFLTLICFRGADALATCAPEATCSTDPRTNNTTRRVCVTAVSRWPMSRAVILKSVSGWDLSKLWFDAVKESRWHQTNANLFWYSHLNNTRPAYRS